MHKRWFAVLSLMIAAVQSSKAQDAGRVGITFQVPAALGFIWHATDQVALRPELNISKSTGKFSSSSGESTQEYLTWELALSAPFYLSNRENVRTYVSPRFGFTRSSFDQSTSVDGQSTNLYSYSASFGAQYAPIKRLNVFGETGYGYSTTSNSQPQFSGSSNSWSMRSSVGVILYFDP
jgi:opacity protein-like surface antigen